MMDFLLFLLTMEKITGEPTEKNLMEYAKKKALKQILSGSKQLLDKTPIMGPFRWKRWDEHRS